MNAICMNDEIVLSSLDDVVKYINNIEGEFIINVSCDDSIKKENVMENELKVVSIRLCDDRTLLSNVSINSPEAAINLLGKYLSDFDREVFCVINLDSSLKPINCSFVSVGTINASIVSPRETFKSSILSNAASIMVMHNHPSGNLNPSKQDCMVTDNLVQCGELLGIHVIDHVIVGPNVGRYYSFKENNVLGEKSRVFPQILRT